MYNKKKFVLFITLIGFLLATIFISMPNVEASTSAITITLSDDNIKVDNKDISTNKSESIYLSSNTDNGGNSDDAIEANIDIENIININSSGTYEFTGNLSDGQISINSNNINGDVIIVLNNVNITCKEAPAIFIYNKETKSSKCNVTIKTSKDSNNIISGGKIKQSVENWSDQTELLYYIDKGYDDEHNYYERYKYDGAISSDISLTFEGEGTLTVNSIKKEGIETKRDLTITNGEYIINSLDDGINACADNESIITINGGYILVNVLAEAEEGDGIDSNGYIYINDGYVYAFANEKSQDSGLDSDLGIYINGGTVVATGNMADAVSSDSKQKFIQFQFNSKVSKNDLITITDKDKNPIAAFESDREYSVLTISTPKFTEDEKDVYEGGKIEGTSKNGLYTQITSFEGGTEKEYNTVSDKMKPDDFEREIPNNKEPSNKIYYYVIITFGIILIILIIISIFLKKKGTILILFIGICTGIILTTTGFMIYNRSNFNELDNEMQNNKQMLKTAAPEGNPPEKPDDNMNPMIQKDNSEINI